MHLRHTSVAHVPYIRNACAAVGTPQGNPDPLTGGISWRPPGASAAPAAAPAPARSTNLVYTPHREYQAFEAAPAADKVAAKVRELSAVVPADVQLTADEASGHGLEALLEVRCKL
jgi:hypothetical protein